MSKDNGVVCVYIHPDQEEEAEEARRFLECSEDNFMLQVMDKPTRGGQSTHKQEGTSG